jgi:hypothetical protein
MKYTDTGEPVRYCLDGPASPNQRGRIQRELDRLGLADRGERLQLVGQLAGRHLDSARDLQAGEAGMVGRVLAGSGSAADAWRIADGPRRARQWARARAQLARQIERITA